MTDPRTFNEKRLKCVDIKLQTSGDEMKDADDPLRSQDRQNVLGYMRCHGND